MTTPPAVTLELSAIKGCHAKECTTTETVQLHPYHGRLCPRHAVLPTIPPGRYQPELALEFVDLGRAGCALQYLAAWLSREIDARFRWAVQAVGG